MNRTVIATFLIIAIWVLLDACFVLADYERGLVTPFGAEPKAVVSPGLHFKAPFASQLARVDARFRTYESRMHPRSAEEGAALVSMAVAHRVEDVKAYSLAFADESRLEAELDELAHKEIALGHADAALRTDLRSRGVLVLFVRPRRIELAEAARKSALERMREEHVREAASIRAAAQADVANVRSNAENERARLLAASYLEERTLRAQADAESAAIYGAAYGKAPELAELLTSLELYENAIHEGDRLVFSTRGGAFQFLTPRGAGSP